MSKQQNGDWSWFTKLLVPLRASFRGGVHPSHAVLRAYMKGQLCDLWRVGVRPLDPENWTLTEVSQHTLTCKDCAQQLALLRRQELERSPSWRDLWQGFPGAIRAHLAVYALALLVLFAVNAFFVMVLPPPIVSLPCSAPGAMAGPAQPADPQSAEINWKREGLARPLSCAPVPAPRPWWQTWWIGWVFLMWTMLLGLHILWRWPVSSTLQRPATASVAIWSIGFISVFV